VGPSLSLPELTFACELDAARLASLFADPAVTEDLLALRARVALMVSDFSDERAVVVRQLNAAGVPVVGIPLLPLAEGYYFTAHNLWLARRWSDRILIHSLEGCVWHGFLGQLRSFDWAAPAGPPPGARAASVFRSSLRAGLRASAHPRAVLGGALALCCLPGLVNYARRRKNP
jgi:hypothetical protein